MIISALLPPPPPYKDDHWRTSMHNSQTHLKRRARFATRCQNEIGQRWKIIVKSVDFSLEMLGVAHWKRRANKPGLSCGAAGRGNVGVEFLNVPLDQLQHGRKRVARFKTVLTCVSDKRRKLISCAERLEHRIVLRSTLSCSEEQVCVRVVLTKRVSITQQRDPDRNSQNRFVLLHLIKSERCVVWDQIQGGRLWPHMIMWYVTNSSQRITIVQLSTMNA